MHHWAKFAMRITQGPTPQRCVCALLLVLLASANVDVRAQPLESPFSDTAEIESAEIKAREQNAEIPIADTPISPPALAEAGDADAADGGLIKPPDPIVVETILAKQDLFAQRVMAGAAIVLLLIGIGQLFLSWKGIKLLAATLKETQIAAIAAHASAEAAGAMIESGKRSAKAAEESLKQSKAYLTIGRVTGTIHNDLNAGINWKFVNSGTTLANEVSYRTGIVFRDLIDPAIPYSDVVPLNSPERFIAPLLANAEGSAFAFIPKEDLSSLTQNPNRGALVRIVISYVDIFGDARATDHMLQFRYAGPAELFAKGIYQEPNTMTTSHRLILDQYIAGQYKV